MAQRELWKRTSKKLSKIIIGGIKMLTIPEYGILSGNRVVGATFQTNKGRYTLIYGMVDISEPFTYMDLYNGQTISEEKVFESTEGCEK